ncbi:cation:proton antiporter [Candidatus Woesearchaeota archaeon]|nr:cation:proton antiporter [Candidatus Woesearchaeota archaeon]
MANVLVFLTYLAVILLIGLLTSILSQRFRIPNILLLLIIGIGLGRMEYKGGPLIYFPELFLTSISILALVMIVFDSASRFKLKRFDYFSLKTLWLSFVFLVFNLIFLTVFTMLIFKVESVFLALIFSAVMSGTDPAAVLTMLKNASNKVFEFLEFESLLNTPLIVLLPFIILELKMTLKDGIIISTFLEQIVPLLQQFVVGIGSGVLIGLVMFKFMRKTYSIVLSPLAVITSALLAYIIAENLEGNGVLAVMSMGLLFGNLYVKQKFQLQEFALVFSNSLEILVFVLIGLIISIPFSLGFFIKSLMLFVIYLLIRFSSISASLRGMNFTLREKIFMSLNVQKGIAVAVVVFSFATLNIEGMQTILNLVLAFMLYSIILSTVVLRLVRFFVVEVKEEKEEKGKG